MLLAGMDRKKIAGILEINEQRFDRDAQE